MLNIVLFPLMPTHPNELLPKLLHQHFFIFLIIVASYPGINPCKIFDDDWVGWFLVAYKSLIVNVAPFNKPWPNVGLSKIVATALFLSFF